MLQAVSFVVIELVQIRVVLKMAGFLDHVFSVFGRGMSAGSKLKEIQVLGQMTDLTGTFRSGHAHSSTQLYRVVMGEFTHGLRQIVEFIDVFTAKVQCHIHFLREHAITHAETHVFGIDDAAALYGTLDLSFGCGEVYPGDVFGILRFLPGNQSHHDHIRFIVVAGEMLSIVELRELHTVVINHAVACDGTFAAFNQKNCCFLTIQMFQFLGAGTSTVGIQIMAAANGCQVRKIRNNRCLLAAEGQVDQILHAGEIQLFGHGLELCVLADIEALQPLSQIIQLVQIDLHPLQTIKYRPPFADFTDMAVGGNNTSNFKCIHQLYAVVVLFPGDGKRNSHFSELRMVRIA